jgi:prevent-host-death family protein
MPQLLKRDDDEVDPDRNDHYSDHVARRMNATAAKSSFLRLLDEAAAGEEIEITRHGRPVARLVPPSGGHSLEGLFQGRAKTAVDEETLLNTEEMWDFD